MDIEIRTTSETWVTTVDDATLGDRPPGTAARLVLSQVQDGTTLRVQSKSGYDQPLLIAFNPAHVVCTVERAPRGA